MDKKIIVIGSSNTDMVIHSNELPSPGETVLGGQFIMNPGGKGANQAVAASKLGGEVVFVAKVGNDVFGQEAIKGFEGHGIDTNFVFSDENSPSGVALIMVNDEGENCISVALGANGALQPSDIDNAREIIANSSHTLIQLEIPIEVVFYTVKMASQASSKIVLNPAPAQHLTDDLLSYVDIITPNETEAELLTGIKVTDVNSARKAARMLREKEVGIVIITMGSQGAYVLSDEEDNLVGCPKVNAIDTTAAGDTFNGALVVGLSEGMNLLDAIAFANQAASLSVTKRGAQASIPNRNELA
ncbi:MAG: ribokinase [Reichenbachiella sp.]